MEVLREVAARHKIVYGAIYMSESLPLFANVWYVRNHEHFHELLERLDMLVATVGDTALVTDFWGVQADDSCPLEQVELARGAFEQLMGFARFGESGLVPDAEVTANVARLHQLREEHEGIQDMLRVLESTKPDPTLN